MKDRQALVLVPAILILALAACRREAEAPPEGAQPVSVVLAAGRAPVDMGPAIPMLVSIGAPTFKVTVKNVTDAPLDAILWTMVPFDESGHLLVEGETDGGYADALNPIAAGESSELNFMISVAEAARVKLVLKEVIYRAPNPLGKEYGSLPMKWTNPFYAAELKTARGVSLPE